MLLNTHIEIGVEVLYDTSPPQKQTMTDPAFDAELEIYSVIHNGLEIIESLAPSALTDLHDIAVEHEATMNDPENEG